MTAHVPSSPGGLEAELAEALKLHRWAVVGTSEVGTDLFACQCGYWPPSSSGMEAHRAEVCAGIAERHAARRAAEELTAAYWATAAIPHPEAVRDVLRARASALDPTTEAPAVPTSDQNGEQQ